MENIVLAAKLRSGNGKGASRQLRLKGRVPGVFYFFNQDNIALDVERFELVNIISLRPGLITLEMDDQNPRECIFRDIQLDPVSDEVLHFDLMGIKRGQKLRVNIPVHLIGIPLGVKTEGGILQYGVSELEIECLPRHIPQSIDIDVSELNIGDSIHLFDLDFPDYKFFADEHIVVAMVSEPAVLKEDIEEVEDEDMIDEEDGEASEEEAESTDSKSK